MDGFQPWPHCQDKEGYHLLYVPSTYSSMSGCLGMHTPTPTAHELLSTTQSDLYPRSIITTFHYKLSITLDLPYSPPAQNHEDFSSCISPPLLDAIRHQNIIGWDCFLRGFTSIYWKHAFIALFNNAHSFPRPDWDIRLVALVIDLYSQS